MTSPPAPGRRPSDGRVAVAGVPGTARAAASRAGVRGIGRSAGRTCARPTCALPAAASLRSSYDGRVVRVCELDETPSADAYDLCERHVSVGAPHGWRLIDERPPPAPAPRVLDRGEDETVAVLAAALGRRRDHPVEPTGKEPTSDPLREALEEVQRVGVGDGDPGPPATSTASAAPPPPHPPASAPPPPPPPPRDDHESPPALW